ncbi:hypothetical protein GYMLUDRAFT_42206 [Collybiopsis luxurians FD-317 M1]|uniref:DUF726-domain-containing protein n=1 Tax=Collybiopsis luxurians FD-317 M1 TaxID=944289 RepID=A0A0D0CSG2_9AGAR|nr:hypothetical protein GYMLUDRAFT_42206 [Collybiopsis luxurians FD-317 M1]
MSRRRDPSPPVIDIFDDDDEGWQDMPVVHQDEIRGGLDEEDQKKYHYRPQSETKYASSSGTVSSLNTSGAKVVGNATGTTLDTDEQGYRWRANPMGEKGSGVKDYHDFHNESNYTRLRHVEEDWDEGEEVHKTSQYLFGDGDMLDDRKAITPLSQMQQTKGLLSESQKIAYVGLCALVTRQMIKDLSVPEVTKKKVKVQVKVPVPPAKDGEDGSTRSGRNSLDSKGAKTDSKKVQGSMETEYQWKTETRYEEKPTGKIRKEFRDAVKNMELWALKIMGRLYYHIELEGAEQRMIESLSQHGVQPTDLVPALQQMKEVPNPEWTHAGSYSYDSHLDPETDDPPSYSDSMDPSHPTNPSHQPSSDAKDNAPGPPSSSSPTKPAPVPKTIMLDMRYTLLTDLFLILIADSVYDSRSRSLLFRVGQYLGLTPWETVVFEGRVVEAVGIQEDTAEEGLQQNQDAVQSQVKALRNRRIALLGLATLGGGLVIGLSAGLLAPVIGVGLGTAFSTIGITGASSFLAGAGGAAVITTGGVLTGAGIAGKGMHRRTQVVRVFDVLPLHKNGRVGCVLSVPGFLNGPLDDPRLPFSVLDPVIGDVFSVLWEPEMIRETGSALKILTGEVLSQIGQTVLQATVMATLMTALQWPIILTKLGYLIDNPWSNALDRARAAGLVLASVLRERQLGVRPVTLIGFSLGARVIFYALLDLAKTGSYGIVQDVFLLGATLSVSKSMWEQTRSVVGGRYVNVYARNDWVLNYLFRASSAATGNVNAVAGLRPILDVQGIENVDVTDKIAGHMSYRVYMPLILEELGFRVTEKYFDEVEEPDFEGDRVVVTEEQETEKKGWFGRRNNKRQSTNMSSRTGIQRPPSYASWADKDKAKSKMNEGSIATSATTGSTMANDDGDDDLPPREDTPIAGSSTPGRTASPVSTNAATADPSSRSSTPTPGSKGVPLHGDSSTSTLPKTAGFDLAAIKAELEGAKVQGTGEMGAGADLGIGPTRGAYVSLDKSTHNPDSRFDLAAIKDVLDSEGIKVDGVVLPAMETPRIDSGLGSRGYGPTSLDLHDGDDELQEAGDPFADEDEYGREVPPAPPEKFSAAALSYPNQNRGIGTSAGGFTYSGPSSASLAYNPFASASAGENFSLPNTFERIPSAGLGSGFGSSFGFGGTGTGSAGGGVAGISFGGADGSISLGSPDPWAVPSQRKEENNPWG